MRRAAAIGVALIALACYHFTLLPGLDFGDTASFQTGVGSIDLTPRQAYPLYYGLGNVFAWIVPGEPAHALNVASAVYGALAAAVITWIAIELTGLLAAGFAAGFFLAFSYTFWTQAIIAEVYTLHLLMTGLCVASLLWWSRRPTLGWLAVFYGIYALGFGNHLSMVLLLPAFTAFILLHRRAGPDDPLRSKGIVLALTIAALGSLQYAWNFRGLWLADTPPAGLWDALAKFWFDVTKADWRQTLVATVSESGLQTRPAMYWFDLRQQFGLPGVLLAIAGFLFIGLRWWQAAVLLLLCYLTNLIFAWNYNVGDVHVFFLPSHYIVALCAGAGVAALEKGAGLLFRSTGKRSPAPFWAALLLAYPLWRGYDTFPAVDRSWDHRPTRVMEQLTDGRAVFGVDTNWQIQNAVEYYVRQENPGVAWFTSDELKWLSPDLSRAEMVRRAQTFVAANADAGRRVIVTEHVRAKLLSLGYPQHSGEIQDIGFLQLDFDDAVARTVGSLRSRPMYALGILRPDREFSLDTRQLAAVWSDLTGGSTPLPALQNYAIAIGRVGQKPSLLQVSNRPFRTRVRIGSNNFDVRMESWLPTDTIRRAGFGHVIIDRRHALTLERGISFVWFDANGSPSPAAYESGIFGTIPRFEMNRLTGVP